MKISRNWDKMDSEDQLNVLEDAFESMPALPNQAVLLMLHGNIEVSSVDEDEERYTGYQAGANGIVWICANCGHSTTFQSMDDYVAGAPSVYQQHLPDCI